MNKHNLGAWAVALCALGGLLGCGDNSGEGPTGGTSTGGSGVGAGGGSAGGGSSGGAGGAGGEIAYGPCHQADGPGTPDDRSWVDGAASATLTSEADETCQRTYHLETTGPLRDGEPENPRTFSEQDGQLVVRTGHDLFDALLALALEEVRQDSVDAISDYAFNGGQPIPCAEGGCFETGRLWTYAWTRDTAYAVTLGLAHLDPARSRNSLEFKTSLRRNGTNRQIVQDTGTGGSYPVSTDRVVWAMGAWEVLKFLEGSEREDFLDLAYDAIVNTAEQDREVAWDPSDGLYRGEQSFLDWREQSYPQWVAGDVVQIAMSKALSTNLGHYVLLDVGSMLAEEKGDAARSSELSTWASELATAIRDRFYLPDRGGFSTFTTTAFDPAPVQGMDLLGSALAVTSGVATASQAAASVAGYPHLPKGAPVIWPQQQDVPIYHNRGIWPFVTSFWLRAAKRADNAPVVAHGVRSLMRGAALNLSNMENFEAATGANWLGEGATSGPVVNSQRQLWSVAGYVSMVVDVLFGFEPSQTGLRFNPYLPAELRNTLFAGSDSLALSNLRYRGRRIGVVLRLPAVGPVGGALAVESVRLNGVDVGAVQIDESELGADNLFEIQLGSPGQLSEMNLLDDAQVADYRNVFGPHAPMIQSIGLNSDRVEIGWSAAGEASAEVTFNVYRDGALVAAELPGTTTTWVDPTSASHATKTYCYSVEAVFIGSSNPSQHAKPVCYWGPGAARIAVVGAQSFAASGGQLVFEYGKWHYQGWGDQGDSLTVVSFVPNETGPHYIQLTYGNGAASSVSTGITCAVKLVEIFDGPTLVGSGQIVMPQTGAWDVWRDSTVVPVSLQAGKSYTVVIREDERSGNMSDFAHFALYGGDGGIGGRFNRVNIAELKVLSLEAQ